VPLPDWQLEPDEEVWGNALVEEPLVDADGNPIDPALATDPYGTPLPAPQPGADGEPDQIWLDEVLDRNPQPPAPAPRAPPPGTRPPPPSAPADPLEPGAEGAQF